MVHFRKDGIPRHLRNIWHSHSLARSILLFSLSRLILLDVDELMTCFLFAHGGGEKGREGKGRRGTSFI